MHAFLIRVVSRLLPGWPSMLTALALIPAPAPVLAGSPSSLSSSARPAPERLVAACANCHGTNGMTAGDALPPLAGQPKERLIKSMQAFRSGTRPSTIMQQIAKGYSDDQIESMAAWLAVQPVARDR